MARVRRGSNKVQRRKRIMRLAKGYFGAKSKLYRTAKEQVERSLQFAYVGRKLRKRDFRRLWIVRINAACRLNGISYSQFIHGIQKAEIGLDRKMLADIALHDEKAFGQLVSQAKEALG